MKRELKVCPWCGEPRALRANNTFQKHGFVKNLSGAAEHAYNPCEGSGRSPDIGNEDLSRPRLTLRNV